MKYSFNQLQSPFRPTTSKVISAIFSMLGPSGPKDMIVLDAYAGEGSVGIEAAKRGAKKSIFIEQNNKRCNEIRKKVEKLNLSMNTKIIRGNTLKSIKKIPEKINMIFADPPYKLNEFDDFFYEISNNKILNKNAIIFIEHYKKNILPKKFENSHFTLEKLKLYGDTAISIYKQNFNGEID
ncbi:MAG: RsmD family RNA methyltransferase [Dehalococcoidia bacterium]